MARVIVHETFPIKLKNGSVQVLEPRAEYQIVKREIADALVASGRGVLDETDMQFVDRETKSITGDRILTARDSDTE